MIAAALFILLILSWAVCAETMQDIPVTNETVPMTAAPTLLESGNTLLPFTPLEDGKNDVRKEAPIALAILKKG